MSLSLADRRRHARRPKLMRFVLSWRRSEEKVFTTDVSLSGMFLRTTIAPPPGSEITIVLPEARATDECLRVDARVVRIVRRGDPYNPLGGIGVEVRRIRSPRGSGPVNELLTTLLGAGAPQLPEVPGSIAVTVPGLEIDTVKPTPAASSPSVEAEEISFGDARAEPTRTVAVEFAVFCRWRNMIIQASLVRLGSEQAVLGRLKVAPEVGDEVMVRMLGIADSRFRGLQFTGRVDQLMHIPETGQTHVSLALDPLDQQPEMGGLRAFLRRLESRDDTRS